VLADVVLPLWIGNSVKDLNRLHATDAVALLCPEEPLTLALGAEMVADFSELRTHQYRFRLTVVKGEPDLALGRDDEHRADSLDGIVSTLFFAGQDGARVTRGGNNTETGHVDEAEGDEG